MPNCNVFLFTGKTQNEIREYSAVFWDRYLEIPNIGHILDQCNSFKRVVRIDPKYQVEIAEKPSRQLPSETEDSLLWNPYLQDDTTITDYLTNLEGGHAREEEVLLL